MSASIRVDGVMVATVAAVGVIWWAYSQKELIGRKLNPASTENVIYDGVFGGVGRVLTGDEDWSLGGQWYDWFGDKPEPIQ